MTSAATVLLQSTPNDALMTSSSPPHQKNLLSPRHSQDGCDAADEKDGDIDVNVDDYGNEEDDLDDFDEEDDLCDDDNDDEQEVAALLELEEEEMMKLEEDEMVASFDSDEEADCVDSGAHQSKENDDDQPADGAKLDDDVDSTIVYHPYQYSRGRARTLSIEIDRFDLDDASTSFFDGVYTGDEVGSMSDLPPLLLSKLLSRSRSNSVATAYAQGPTKGAEASSVDTFTTSSIRATSKTTDTTESGKLAVGADVSIALHRGRGYSLEFFSFGFNTEEPLPLESSSSGGADCDVTPLVKNGAYHRERGDSLTLDVNEKLRPRAESISIIFGISDEQRPRGDSIIFDPCSFSDGGIHEQRALLIKNHGSSIGSINEVEGALSTHVDDRRDTTPDRVASAYSLGKNVASEPLSEKGKNNAPVDKSKVQINYVGTITTDPGDSVVAQSSTTAFSSSCVNTCVSTCNPSNGTALSLNEGSGEMMTMPSCLSGNMAITMEFLNKDGRIGIYLPEERKKRVAKFHLKRKMRIWRKRIKYDCRKKLADSRPRIKGRFVRRSDVENDSVDGID